jgi:hypothetical protein
MRRGVEAFLIGAMLSWGAAQGASPSLELRLVVPCHPDDKPYLLAGSTEGLCLAPTPIFDASGVVRVQRYPTVAVAVMEISQAASEKLYEATSDEAAERVGVLFKGRLIYAPLIGGQPIKTTTLSLRLKDNPEDVDALVEAFPGAAAAP